MHAISSTNHQVQVKRYVLSDCRNRLLLCDKRLYHDGPTAQGLCLSLCQIHCEFLFQAQCQTFLCQHSSCDAEQHSIFALLSVNNMSFMLQIHPPLSDEGIVMLMLNSIASLLCHLQNLCVFYFRPCFESWHSVMSDAGWTPSRLGGGNRTGVRHTVARRLNVDQALKGAGPLGSGLAPLTVPQNVPGANSAD